MNITIEEKLMYEIMKAIYESGIPINFKGSMVLKASLIEAGYSEETRHTVDIDANWNCDTPPSAEQMVNSFQKALNYSDIDLNVGLYRMYGEGRSAGFEITDKDTGEKLFTMDVDVNRPVMPTKIYEVSGIRFRGVAPIQMIADKVSVISGDKVFRRIKDVVDLYYMSNVFDFDRTAVLQTIKNCGRTLENFNGFLHRTDDLKHSYEKFRFAGGVNKPPFEEVYSTVKSYIRDILPKK
ncbi:MAG: nucleotidyl transferase AbiEii/AbiGii toxin family protein [Ruminococcus sp.]|nr:nucleotidyl transferase AbiEii/AbiGii toxin family protein [Ruminococcus sp.]